MFFFRLQPPPAARRAAPWPARSAAPRYPPPRRPAAGGCSRLDGLQLHELLRVLRRVERHDQLTLAHLIPHVDQNPVDMHARGRRRNVVLPVGSISEVNSSRSRTVSPAAASLRVSTRGCSASGAVRFPRRRSRPAARPTSSSTAFFSYPSCSDLFTLLFAPPRSGRTPPSP